MLLDCLAWGVLVLCGTLGAFARMRSALAMSLTVGVLAALLPLCLPPLAGGVARLGCEPWPATWIAWAALVPAPALGALVLARRSARTRAADAAPRQLWEGLATGLLSAGGGAALVASVLLAGASRGGCAFVSADHWSLGLRSSRLYALVERRAHTPSDRLEGCTEEPASGTAIRANGAPARIQADLSNPRVRAALSDPVVQKAIVNGDVRELEKRNRLLRPLVPAPARAPPNAKTPLESLMDGD